MSGTSRASQPVHFRFFVALLAALATAVGLATPLALAAPAAAAPGDPVWAATGTGTVTTVSDGTASAAQMTYDATGTFTGSWTFTATATTTGTVTVPWSWQGLHAWFRVTTHLEAFDTTGTHVLVNDGPVNCCTAPSNGFVYGGVQTFQVTAGQTYGFRLSGSNQDFNDFLRGTFTLSTKPYLDATIGNDNRQWTGAATLDPGNPGKDGSLGEAGEARWYRFPVVPGQQATVTMSTPNQDYDIALYGDIQTAFDQLTDGSDLSQLAAASAQAAPGSGSQVPDYPAAVTDIPTSNQTRQFAPRIYAPRIYAPRIYAPRIYAPRIYAPRIYAPRIYAPDAYDPGLAGDAEFSDAFSAAQNQTLLAVSANVGTAGETVSAPTGNTSGYFYVRVQGHSDQTPPGDFHLHLAIDDDAGTHCVGLTDESDVALGLDPPDGTVNPQSVLVTDSGRLDLAPGSSAYDAYQSSLTDLAGATDGVTLDLTGSPRVQALWDQVAGHPTCPYAVNLVASAIKDLVDEYRGTDTQYVVLAGGDDVIPFFRYPDVSGLGQESLFSPPMRENTPSYASLKADQVQSQDAYGTDTTVTLGGATLPVPDLAVGRLVKTPDEIESTVDHYLELAGGTLPTPTSSLVTGYDFLADAADAVHGQFADAIPGGTADTLVDHPGVTDGSGIDNWDADKLSHALLDAHHDLVYLAGHFSANDTLAADFDSAFEADDLAPDGDHPDALEDTVVLSAGCHSAYNIVDDDSTDVTNPFDWTQRMAEQHAVLIGGTGYQYGDSDFLEYSERLYLDVAKRLHEGPASGNAPPVAVGSALVQAKQDYLSGLSTVSGLDQKAMLEASLYGLPMTGFDAPGRTPIGSDVSQADPHAVDAGTPGDTFGLRTDDLSVDTPTQTHTKDSGVDPGDNPGNLPQTSTWLAGRDGVSVLPGAPALPKQIENVTVPDLVLRGVGFRGGTYTDSTGILPVTGAPAIEGSTPNTTFESDAFFPQRLITPNYFGTLGGSGRTSLILTPGQYRSDQGALTDTQRAYSHMDMRLFYSGSDSQAFGQNQPSLAAAPSIGNVQGTASGGVVTFSATVTGDPSAGVQQVWVTWTGTGADSGHGTWRSVDLSQDPNDSTHWTGTLPLPGGQSSSGMRFLVQAANGVGAVGMDTAEGDGYRVLQAGADTAQIALATSTPTTGSPFGVTATVTNDSGPVANRTVRFTVSKNGTDLFQYADASAPDGTVVLRLPAGEGLPSGQVTVRADLIGDDGEPVDSQQVQVVLNTATLTLSPTSAKSLPVLRFPDLTATLTDGRGPLAGVPVTFTLPTNAPGALFPQNMTTATVTTNAQGVAVAPRMTSRLVVGTFAATVTAPNAPAATEALATTYLVGPFASPIKNGGTTTAPVKAKTRMTTMLFQPVQLVPDATATALVAAHRIQIRWRQAGTTGPWTARTDLVTYDAKKHTFNADLVGTQLGWVKGKTYTVTFRVLPGAGDIKPPGEDPVNGSFDLGSNSFTIKLT